ncbi:unnamed protein product [Larinioides sclopetarius]|uniref:Uncharacterized protein n=1 Tax=Larinioides sclopetarius TaxID=280406 RepID=A0AAV2AA31_9ARAC
MSFFRDAKEALGGETWYSEFQLYYEEDIKVGLTFTERTYHTNSKKLNLRRTIKYLTPNSRQAALEQPWGFSPRGWGPLACREEKNSSRDPPESDSFWLFALSLDPEKNKGNPTLLSTGVVNPPWACALIL